MLLIGGTIVILGCCFSPDVIDPSSLNRIIACRVTLKRTSSTGKNIAITWQMQYSKKTH